MENQIYIPKKLKVGYQKRLDTYTKKLAYVIYYDEKGKLRKETSWNGWIDKKQGIDEFENVPTEGFVLNKNVGGIKNSYSSWSSDVRIEKVRVYDPRGFEFEIDIPNVLTILQECTSAKGKGLEGTFVYGWNGPNLVLLPTSSSEYQQSLNYTALQASKISSKSLIVGASYKTKKNKDLIYLGKFDWVEKNYRKGGWFSEKKFIFVDENAHLEYYDDEVDMSDFDDEKDYQKYLDNQAKDLQKAIKKGENFNFIPLASVLTLALCNSEIPVSHYADLLERFNKTHNASMPTSFIERSIKPNLEIKPSYGSWDMKIREELFMKGKDNKFISVSLSPTHDYYSNKKPTSFDLRENRILYFDKKGNLISDYSRSSYPYPKYTKEQIEAMEFYSLSVKLNNNKVTKITTYL